MSSETPERRATGIRERLRAPVRTGPTVTEINLFRYVPRDTPVHRLWAGTKIVGIVAIGVVISLKPTWAVGGLVFAVMAATMALARVPVGALPRFPMWFWIGVGITAISAGLAGGKPDIHLGGLTIGLGGLDQWGRFTLIVLIFIWSASLVGWTTRGGELTPALATLAAPARLVRVPVDEVALVVALAVRCMPLLIDEMRTLWAARRVRNPPQPDTLRELFGQLNDILVTALVSSARRAQEMADAIEARGGVGQVVPSRPRLVTSEIVAWLVVAGTVVGVVLV
ncbi:MAG TPA: energy-coupling factor transporter transmembrane protein EcfT [Acidimicrobiales bacterium]|nr:energy-coupling factor transporter transmembrane protein EcfT [Acidimicrobiales bacterium]